MKDIFFEFYTDVTLFNKKYSIKVSYCQYDSTPTEKQVRTYERFINAEELLLPKIETALLKEYNSMLEDSYWIPLKTREHYKVEETSALSRFIHPLGIDIYDYSPDDVVVLTFSVEWNDEGLGVLIQNNEIAIVGKQSEV